MSGTGLQTHPTPVWPNLNLTMSAMTHCQIRSHEILELGLEYIFLGDIIWCIAMTLEKINTCTVMYIWKGVILINTSPILSFSTGGNRVRETC